MNLYLYSANDNVIKHFTTLFAENKNRIFYFTSLSDLQKALETVRQPLLLLFHLDTSIPPETASDLDADSEHDKLMEAELAELQSRFKAILNTLVLTNHPYPQQGVRVLALNVRGYANTYLDSHKLETAIKVIQQGELWVGSALINYMLDLNKQAPGRETLQQEKDNTNAQVFKNLSKRERQIAQKILAGLQNKRIASELDITERTVKAHLTTIYKKLNVRNRLELTLKMQVDDRREPRALRKAT